MTRSRIRIVAALAATAVAALAAPLSHATTMSGPVNIAQMVHDAPVIVSGTVTSVRTTRTGNMNHVEVTLDVARGIRGASEGTLTFRQIGLAAPEGMGDGRIYVGGVAGMPQYAKGEHVLLFLGPESRAGFRAPIGLGQGKFDIAGGNAMNESGNRDLFRAVSTNRAPLNEKQKAMLATTKGVVSAETLVGLVQRAVDEDWWGAPAGPRGSLDDRISLDRRVQKAGR